MTNSLTKNHFSKFLIVTLFFCLSFAFILPLNAEADATSTIIETRGGAALEDTGLKASVINAALAPINIILRLAILPLVTILMSLGGWMLDEAIKLSLNTGYITSLNSTINFGWALIRDFCNMLFIFLMIWISIATILRLSNFNTKRMLTKVIIAALLINFSLFFTKTIVDIGNIFGNWLNNGIKSITAQSGGSIAQMIRNESPVFGPPKEDQTGFFDSVGTGATTGLVAGSIFLGGVGAVPGVVTGALAGAIKWFTEALNTATPLFVITMLDIILRLIMTYVFFYAAFLFIGRCITIIFLLVFSPIMFLGEIVPRLKDYTSKWWHDLIDAVTFPVVFLLIIYIALLFIDKIDSVLWTGVPSTGENIWTTSMNAMFLYALIIGMFLAALKGAKEASGSSGKLIAGIAGSVASFATGATAGITAKIGREVVGGGAAAMANSTAMQNMAARPGVTGFMARIGQDRLQGVSKRSFDVRGTGAAKMLGKEGVDLGKPGGKGGYSAAQKARDEAARDRAAKMKPTDREIEQTKTGAELYEGQARKNLEDRLIANDSGYIESNKTIAFLEKKKEDDLNAGMGADHIAEDIRQLQEEKNKNEKIVEGLKKSDDFKKSIDGALFDEEKAVVAGLREKADNIKDKKSKEYNDAQDRATMAERSFDTRKRQSIYAGTVAEGDLVPRAAIRAASMVTGIEPLLFILNKIHKGVSGIPEVMRDQIENQQKVVSGLEENLKTLEKTGKENTEEYVRLVTSLKSEKGKLEIQMTAVPGGMFKGPAEQRRAVNVKTAKDILTETAKGKRTKKVEDLFQEILKEEKKDEPESKPSSESSKPPSSPTS